MKKTISLILLLMFAFGCGPGANQGPTPPKTASLRFDWIANMNFVGDVYAMRETTAKNGLQLKCEQAGFGVDPIKLVLSGGDDFGVVSLEQLYMANDKGADLVAIGVINDVSPTVLLAKGKGALTQPKDLEGKKVGINPGGATEFVYRAFVKANNVDTSKVKEVPVDFDLKNFINGSYDVRLAFAFIEPFDLKLAGIEYSELKPLDFGVKFPGRVYFTKKEKIEKNPELVQAFINSVAEGWELALSNRAKAIEYLKKYEEKVDPARETESLEVGASYFVGFNNKVLTFDRDNILKSAKTLVDLGVIKNAEVGPMLNDTFINKYHSSKR